MEAVDTVNRKNNMKRFIVITVLLLVSAWLDKKERELINGS